MSPSISSSPTGTDPQAIIYLSAVVHSPTIISTSTTCTECTSVECRVPDIHLVHGQMCLRVHVLHIKSREEQQAEGTTISPSP